MTVLTVLDLAKCQHFVAFIHCALCNPYHSSSLTNLIYQIGELALMCSKQMHMSLVRSETFIVHQVTIFSYAYIMKDFLQILFQEFSAILHHGSVQLWQQKSNLYIFTVDGIDDAPTPWRHTGNMTLKREKYY